MSLQTAIADITSELGFEFSASVFIPMVEIHRALADEWIVELRVMISKLTPDEKVKILAKFNDAD